MNQIPHDINNPMFQDLLTAQFQYSPRYKPTDNERMYIEEIKSEILRILNLQAFPLDVPSNTVTYLSRIKIPSDFSTPATDVAEMIINEAAIHDNKIYDVLFPFGSLMVRYYK